MGNILATSVQLIMQQLFIFLSVPGTILDPGDTGVSKNNIISSLGPLLTSRGPGSRYAVEFLAKGQVGQPRPGACQLKI